MTYAAELGVSSIFVDFDSSLPSLIVKASSLSNVVLKIYNIKYTAKDECNKESDSLDIEI